MSTKEARTRANAAWRSRTSAKPVQIYLPPDTLAKLDILVKERGASGRAAVLAELIEAAAQAHQRPVEAPAPAPLPEPVRAPAPAPRKRDPLDPKVIKADLRAAARLCQQEGDENGRRQAARAWEERATPGEKRKAPVWLRLPV